MLSSLLALCEGNPPVTGGFPSHRASNADVLFFFVASLNKLVNNQLSGVLRQQHVMSLQQVTLNVANGKLVEYAGSVGTQYSMVSYHVIMWSLWHYNDVIMSMMASQITNLMIVYSTVYSGTDQRKHQSSTSLAFVRGIHRWPVNSLNKWPVTRKMFPFDDIIMMSIVEETDL